MMWIRGTRITTLPFFCALLLPVAQVSAFVSRSGLPVHSSISCASQQWQLSSAAIEQDAGQLVSFVAQLKKVLEKEYVSFFDPMERDYYSPTVTFEDPMTSLAGVDSYQNNVDMLSSRTLMGKILFRDAGIVLHSVEGGDIQADGSISNIITRWTLRVTAKVLPWSPTARFSGVSVYEVVPGGPKGVLVQHQTDYWDSINIKNGGGYQKVDKSMAISDFLNQLKPGNAIAPSAGPELPYQLLRRGDGYEVRQYPSYSVVKLPYSRRDEAFSALGSFTSGMSPLSPAIMDVGSDFKSMAWPLSYTAPGQVEPSKDPSIAEKMSDSRFQALQCQVETIPSQVVAVGRFSDASVEPVVRKADAALRKALQRDGLKPVVGSEANVRFAQFDAIYSMGQRRGEVWINLEDGGHPW